MAISDWRITIADQWLLARALRRRLAGIAAIAGIAGIAAHRRTGRLPRVFCGNSNNQ
jgi:hypothetical protein